jgi:hypothetical protein
MITKQASLGQLFISGAFSRPHDNFQESRCLAILISGDRVPVLT